MERAASTGTPAAPAPEGRRDLSWPRAVTFAAAAGAFILAMYLAHPLASGFRLPVGPDGPVYLWWTRYADVAGLAAVPGARPGIPAIALALHPLLGMDALEAVTVLGPVLAAAAGLAAAALLETALGPSFVRAAAAAVLTGAFAAYLAGGWLGNTALVALFLAAVTALALARVSWRAVAGAGALLAAAAAAHPVVSLFVVAVLGGVAVVHLPGTLRRPEGEDTRDAFPIRLAGALGIAAVGAAAMLLPSIGATVISGDTAQDGFFRRLGLRELLRARYRERLGGDVARAAIPLLTGGALGALAWTRRRGGAAERYVWSLIASWAVVTLVALVALALTASGPPNRVVVFAFFVPLAAAIGIGAAFAHRRAVVAVGAAFAAAAFVAVSMFGWFRQSPAFTDSELATARAAGAVAASVPVGTPVVFVVDTDQPAAAYHVTRALNVLRAGLPPERIPDSHAAVGALRDVLAGRPTITGDDEHDAISRTYLSEMRSATRGRRPLVIVAEPFNPGPVTTSPSTPLAGIASIGTPIDATLGVAPAALVVMSLAVLGALLVLGAGWSRWLLIGVGRRAVTCAAPAVGIGVVMIAAVLGDHIGLDAGGWSGATAILAVAATGYVLAVLRPASPS